MGNKAARLTNKELLCCKIFFLLYVCTYFQTYKPPSSQDCPENFRTYLYDSGNNTGILSSKVSRFQASVS